MLGSNPRPESAGAETGGSKKTMISSSQREATSAWVNDSLEALRQPYNTTHDPIRELDLRFVMESLPDDSREFLEEYIDSIHSSDAASQLKFMLEKLAGSEGISAATLEAIGIRVLSILWALQSQKWDICGMSLTELGRRTGKTKAIFSHWVKRNERDFGIHARGQKMLESSKAYKQSVQAGWSTRRKKNPEKMSETERATALLQIIENNKKNIQCN